MKTLWFIMLGGHIAWSAHLLLSYFLADLGCASDAGGASIGLHVVTFTAAAMTVTVAGLAMQIATSNQGSQIGPVGERQFLSRFGLALNGIFLLAIVRAGSINFFLVPCV